MIIATLSKRSFPPTASSERPPGNLLHAMQTQSLAVFSYLKILGSRPASFLTCTTRFKHDPGSFTFCMQSSHGVLTNPSVPNNVWYHRPPWSRSDRRAQERCPSLAPSHCPRTKDSRVQFQHFVLAQNRTGFKTNRTETLRCYLAVYMFAAGMHLEPPAGLQG